MKTLYLTFPSSVYFSFYSFFLRSSGEFFILCCLVLIIQQQRTGFMKIPLSWLQEYINPGCSPAQIAALLTSAGLEVDAVETTMPNFERVVVGRVVRVEKHPNADKLCLASVTDGVETYQVVCGAPNCREGLKTAFAMVGALLPESSGKRFQVNKAKLRGVESFGMLCSAKELEIGGEHDGIIEFGEHLKEGTDVAEMYADTVFDISLTPNLGHCANVIGIARELSAVTGMPLRYPKIEIKENKQSTEKAAHVIVEDGKGCPRYACRVIKNVKIGPSPEWMQKRLSSCGLRPINNIVDITNYVLLEMGQPLHAFDYDKLEGHTIIVRSAQKNEPFVTLDEKERILEKGDILICDQKKPVTIGGVMGGLNSEVSETTTNILLEAAYFHAGTIRKTSKRLGLQTDSSRRFERGSDPNALIPALNRAAMLIQQLAGGDVLEGVIDLKKEAFPDKQIPCRLSRINSLLGTHLSVSEVENIFKRLQFSYKWDGVDTFTVTIPTFRVDVTAEIDLVEEVARIYGYNNIQKSAMRYQASTLPHTPIFLFEREIRSRLVSEGLQEFITCDLIGPTLSGIVKEHLMPEEAIIKVLNPMSIEQSILRTTLLPGLLQLVKYNIDHQNHDISGFEIGRIHFKDGEQYKEESVVGIVLTGKNIPHHWDLEPHDADFYDLKGILENFLGELGISNALYKESAFKSFHSGRQASITVDNLKIGSIGEIHPKILRRLDVTQRIIFAELSLHDLMKVRKMNQQMQPLPRYPASERDWTLTLKEETPVQTIVDQIKSVASPLLEEVSLVAVFRSEKLGKENKNVTFHFVYRDKEKTIEQNTVDAEHARITSAVTSNLVQKV